MPGDKIKILVTGFEPFSDTYNVSGEVVNRLQQMKIAHPNIELVTVVLPSTYVAAETLLKNTIAAEKPDFVISLGEIESCKWPGVKVETSVHSRSALEDTLRQDRMCLSPTNDNLRWNLTNPPLSEAARASFNQYFPKNNNFRISGDAGDYLCNDTFYHVMKLQAERGLEGKAFFLHLNDIANPLAKGKRADREEEKKLLANYRVSRSNMVGRYANVVNDLIRYISEHPDSYALYVTVSSEALPEIERRTAKQNLNVYEALMEAARSVQPRFPQIDLLRVKQMEDTEIRPPLLPKLPTVKQRE